MASYWSTPLACPASSPLRCFFGCPSPRRASAPEDTYKTKPAPAVEIIKETLAWDFRFDVVLADCLYGGSTDFLEVLERLHLIYVIIIRSNHKGREIIYGQCSRVRSSLLTTDPTTLPKDEIWYLMTNLAGRIEKTIGNTYGLRTWIEYGLKHAKNELDWASYRVTDYAEIERW